MNWVIGHLLCVYNNVLPVLGQERVMDPETLNRYNRGAAPIHNETALPFDDLMSALNDAVARFDAGLAASTDEVLDGKAPFSPTNDPTETVRSVMGFVMFHQAYHAGQTGVLRRVIGKPGAI
jgi:uncharacterized damage-inducible protein DinB